jgi:uncharacterized membrane protein YfcA
MILIAAKILIGLMVGTLVGLTGLGGGMLLLPLLIFGLHVPPIVAVGSDALINFVTKIAAGYLHWRQRTVNWAIVRALAKGSIPGAIAGVVLLAQVRARYGDGVNDFLKNGVGVLLVAIPMLLVVKKQLSQSVPGFQLPKANSAGGIIAIGALAGFLVGFTSVGAGSVIMILLLLFYGFAPAALVGTDIVHAVLLTGTTSLMHLRLGTVDLVLVSSVLLGSIPGGLLGTRLTARVPVYWLKRVLCVVIFITGAKMLWV